VLGMRRGPECRGGSGNLKTTMATKTFTSEQRLDIVSRWRRARGHQTQEAFLQQLAADTTATTATGVPSSRALRDWMRMYPDPAVPADALRQVLEELLDVVDGVRGRVVALQHQLHGGHPSEAEVVPEAQVEVDAGGDHGASVPARQPAPVVTQPLLAVAAAISKKEVQQVDFDDVT
jgi:hypothetical protein